MSFEGLARLLLPPGAGPGAAVRAGDAWRPPGAAAAAEHTIVWGREPAGGLARLPLARYAARRERALLGLRARGAAGRSVVRAHRWQHRFYRARVAPGAAWRLGGGLVVELARPDPGSRLLDLAGADAGLAGPVERFHIGVFGSVVALLPSRDGRGSAALRVAPPGSAQDPAHGAAALQRLAPLGLSAVPRALGAGRTGDAAWTTESVLPGRAPARLSAGLVDAVADFCARLPRDDGPPAAPSNDLETVAARLPAFRPALARLRARAEAGLAHVPGVLGHGDLWTDNLLVDGGRLSGVVDWDDWDGSAVPGADLVHLVATARAFAAHRTEAEVCAERPWRDPLLAGPLRRVLRTAGADPTDELLELVALAWWAARLRHRLSYSADQAGDPGWQRRHVVPVLGPAR